MTSCTRLPSLTSLNIARLPCILDPIVVNRSEVIVFFLASSRSPTAIPRPTEDRGLWLQDCTIACLLRTQSSTVQFYGIQIIFSRLTDEQNSADREKLSHELSAKCQTNVGGFYGGKDEMFLLLNCSVYCFTTPGQGPVIIYGGVLSKRNVFIGKNIAYLTNKKPIFFLSSLKYHKKFSTHPMTGYFTIVSCK